MSLFSRFSDIVIANLNALLDRTENHEAMLAQMIREMEESCVRARRLAAVAIATANRLRRERDDNRAQSEHCKTRAKQALASGREDLARALLTRKHEHDVRGQNLDVEHAEVVQAGESARAALEALDARLGDARAKQRLLTARQRTAQVRIDVYRNLDNGRANFGASVGRFDRMADRWSQHIEELAAEANLYNVSPLEAECAHAEQQLAVDQELMDLKKQA